MAFSRDHQRLLWLGLLACTLSSAVRAMVYEESPAPVAPTLHWGPQRSVELNGQPLKLRVGRSPAPPQQVLQGCEALLEGAPLLSTSRAEGGFCLALPHHEPSEAITRLLAEAPTLLEGQALSEGLRPRVLLAYPEGQGSLALSYELSAGFNPSELIGEAGADRSGVSLSQLPSPLEATRLLSYREQLAGQEQVTLFYRSTLSPEGVLAHYQRAAEAQGWHGREVPGSAFHLSQGSFEASVAARRHADGSYFTVNVSRSAQAPALPVGPAP